MTATYKAVAWNRSKAIYDAVLIGCVALYLAVFIAVGMLTHRADHAISAPLLVIRALGSCAFIMLAFAISIGPLNRLSKMFAPLLYNRRHLGVATFLVAFAHAALVVQYFGAFGDRNPIVAVLAGDLGDGSLSDYPFEILGFFALLILFVMAATSHDFWLKNLTPSLWKSLHMLVYVAFGLLIAHVALGAVQTERNPVYAIVLGAGALTVIALHLTTGVREWRRDAHAMAVSPDDSWIDVAASDDVREGVGKVIYLAGRERVALFRHQGAITAMTNVCPHQGGPLGEGQIVDGCVTCPWHGHQFDPTTGRAPAPYTDAVTMLRVRTDQGRILINPTPNAPNKRDKQ